MTLPSPMNTMTDENDDFQEMVEPSGRKHARLQATQFEITTRCSLCTALWSNRGPHRIVSLMCGHTFGEKCILDLIKLEGLNATCPNCRDAIRRHHLRPIWPNKIIHDNDSILKLKLELEQAQATLEDILRQLDNTNSQYLQCCSALREMPDDHPLPSQDPTQRPQKTLPPPLLDAPNASFQLVDTMMLSNERQVARVMTVVPDEEMVVATMKKGTQSHGLYKLSLRDLRSSEYLGNHTGLVRDVKSSVNVIDNGNVTLLSTGLDKTLKLTSASNNCTVLSYSLPLAGWSCEFNCVNQNQLYCGLSNNSILVFDIRNTKQHLQQLSDRNKISLAPIHSMISCQLGDDHSSTSSSSSPSSTLICASLTHTYQWDWLQYQQEPICNLFPAQEKGHTPYALAFDRKETSVMVSSRAPGFTKHTIMQQTSLPIDQDDDDLASANWETVWEYAPRRYQKNMARTDLCGGLACFSDGDGAIHLRNKAGLVKTIPAEQDQPVVDTKMAHIQDRFLLISLTDNKIKIYNKYG